MNAGINPKHLLEYVIKPTLSYLEKDSASARILILCTSAVESRLGHYLKQKNDGPALGIYQTEPKTHLDIYKNYLRFNPDLTYKLKILSKYDNYLFRERELISNLEYATAIARIHYLRISEELPESGDINGMAVYWKNYYNTVKGKGTIEDFIHVYHKYIESYLNEF